MDYAFLEPWDAFLPDEAGHVIGLAGDGDLPGMARAMGHCLAARGLTTLLCGEKKRWPGFAHRPVTGAAAGVYLAGGAGDGGGATLDDLREAERQAVLVYAVADLLDSPPESTSLSMIVMDGRKVGWSTSDVLAPEVIPPGQRGSVHPSGLVWTWDDLRRQISGPGGWLECLPPEVPVVCGISGLEEVADSIGMFAMVDGLMQHPRLPLMVFMTQTADQLTTRTAYRNPGPEGT